MKQIDEAKLESDLGYRFEYLAEFIGFGEQDVNVILGAKDLLAPIVPALVDAVYDKLFSYHATARHFMPRQSGYEGQVPANIEELGHNHPQVKFRKDKLARYLGRLVTGPYDTKMVQYLDFVGEIHTATAGDKQLVIPLVQMNALMGFVADAVNATIISLNIPQECRNAAIRSFSKLLWIQNDLITRHYQR